MYQQVVRDMTPTSSQLFAQQADYMLTAWRVLAVVDTAPVDLHEPTYNLDTLLDGTHDLPDSGTTAGSEPFGNTSNDKIREKIVPEYALKKKMPPKVASIKKCNPRLCRRNRVRRS